MQEKNSLHQSTAFAKIPPHVANIHQGGDSATDLARGLQMLRLGYKKSIRSSKAWFARVEPCNHCQIFDVLSAVERAARRSFAIVFLRHPFSGTTFPKYRVFSVWQDARLVMLVPLRFAGKEARVIDGFANLAYTDIIWGTDDANVRAEALSLLEKELIRLGVEELSFAQLDEAGETAKLFLKRDPLIKRGVYIVQVPLPGETFDDYFAALSKSSRQTIRTSYNRLERDGCRCAFTLERMNPQVCDRMFEERMAERFNAVFNWRKRLTQMWAHYKHSAFRSDAATCYVLRINGEIAAFMQGFYVAKRHSFEVPRLVMAEKFAKYSPGRLLIVEAARYFYEHTDVRMIDLTRGREPYKLAMGGTVVPMVSLKVDLKSQPFSGQSRK